MAVRATPKGIATTDQWRAALREAGRDLNSVESAKWLIEESIADMPELDVRLMLAAAVLYEERRR